MRRRAFRPTRRRRKNRREGTRRVASKFDRPGKQTRSRGLRRTPTRGGATLKKRKNATEKEKRYSAERRENRRQRPIKVVARFDASRVDGLRVGEERGQGRVDERVLRRRDGRRRAGCEGFGAVGAKAGAFRVRRAATFAFFHWESRRGKGKERRASVASPCFSITTFAEKTTARAEIFQRRKPDVAASAVFSDYSSEKSTSNSGSL